MKNESFLQHLKSEHETFDALRRELIAAAAKAQGASKRAIFAVLREDEAGAKGLLAEAEDAFEAIRSKAERNPRLAHEGSFRAALEEYAEARFIAQIAWKGEVTALEGYDEETQIAGLCDAVGEAVRLMTYYVTAGRDAEARTLKKRLDPIVAGLDMMEYSGYLRTKYDQARSHYRKAEDVLYELSLRGR